MTDVCMTVQGRSRDTTRAISESRARLGVESSNDWLDGYGIQFLDFPFTSDDADAEDHLRVASETYPTVTVAPDVEDGRTLSEVCNMADRLAQYAQDIIIVPKTCHPTDVPDRFRVGVPLADFGSGAPWSVWAYRDCGPVHLLGGGPARQLEVGQHLEVASVDTATLGKACRFGWWDGTSQDCPHEWDYRRRLKESLNNYWDAWNG